MANYTSEMINTYEEALIQNKRLVEEAFRTTKMYK